MSAREAVREAIAAEWHRRVAGQVEAPSDEHIDALAEAVVRALVSGPGVPCPDCGGTGVLLGDPSWDGS